MRKQSIEQKKEKDILLKFLKKTKDGRYAPVEQSSIPYSRIDQQSETIDDIYVYNLN